MSFVERDIEAGVENHRSASIRWASSCTRLMEGNAESEMPALRRGARNLSARDVSQAR
jgi:hypothetical protein